MREGLGHKGTFENVYVYYHNCDILMSGLIKLYMSKNFFVPQVDKGVWHLAPLILLFRRILILTQYS